MVAKSKGGKLLISSKTQADGEQLVNRMRAIVRVLQQVNLDEEHADSYYLLEQLDDLIPEPGQIVIDI